MLHAASHPPLLHRLVPVPHRGLRTALQVALGVAFLALLAQVRVEVGPVPITGQTLGVLLLGAAAGAPIQAVYKLEGERIRGLLYDPTHRAGFTIAVERGARVAAAAPDPNAGLAATFAPAGSLPFKRVVLCLDGVPHRVLIDLKNRGHFKSFDPPARMITVYPSLSSIAWSTLLGLPPEPGYQAVYYANRLDTTMGVTLRKVKGSRFQTRMHHRHTGVISHGLAYVAPYSVGKRQLRHLVRDLIDHRGSRTAFVYAYQTDPIAHMNGREDLEKALLSLEQDLAWLSEEFERRHGERLEVAIVSDHGHTLVSGELVPLEKNLKPHGWKVVSKVEGDKECSFTSAGILSSIGLHCRDASAPALAAVIAPMEGVDLCTYDLGGREQVIVSARGDARFRYDPARGYAYEVTRGADPIGYTDVYARLAAAGRVDADGYASSRDLFEATADHAYPDAPERIRVGHNTLVRNPADVIVSLSPGYENGKGMVKATAALRGRSGTHGGLDQVNSAGVFMTNYGLTLAAVRAADLGRHLDLGDYLANDPPLEVSVVSDGESGATEPAGMWLELRDDGHDPALRTRLGVRLLRSRFLLRDKEVWRGSFEGSDLRREQQTWLVPLDSAVSQLEAGKTYVARVTLERRDRAGKVVFREERRVKLGYRGTSQTFD